MPFLILLLSLFAVPAAASENGESWEIAIWRVKYPGPAMQRVAIYDLPEFGDWESCQNRRAQIEPDLEALQYNTKQKFLSICRQISKRNTN